jgi:hypothetical protein
MYCFFLTQRLHLLLRARDALLHRLPVVGAKIHLRFHSQFLFGFSMVNWGGYGAGFGTLLSARDPTIGHILRMQNAHWGCQFALNNPKELRYPFGVRLEALPTHSAPTHIVQY